MLIALGDIYVQIPRREDARKLMHATQARVKARPGCVSYVFAETLDEPGHFVVVQQWRDRAALDEHYQSDAFADYQGQIGPYLVRSSELRLYDVQASLLPVDSSPIDLSQDD